jgi:hypothetical protein
MKATISLVTGVALLALAATPAAAGPGVAELPPVVVKTVPCAGELNVDPGLKQIEVTFSKKMKTEKMWSFVQVSADTFPETRGQPRFLKEGRTVVLPVALKPGHSYALWLNRGELDAFRDAAGRPAVPYLLVFETAKKPQQKKKRRGRSSD